METETITTVIKNPYPKTMSRRHMANIIDRCADEAHSELASWGAELSLLFRNGGATAVEACQYFIDALNETVDDVAWYSLDLNYNLTVTRPTENDHESLLETLDILDDDDLMAALAEADDDVDNGDLEDLEEN